MSPKSFEERLLASAAEAVAIVKGKKKPALRYELRTAKNTAAIPAPFYSKADIGRIRDELGVSQAVFARALNVSTGSVRSWEQGTRVPDGAAARLLQIAHEHPKAIAGYLRVADGSAVHSNKTRVYSKRGASSKTHGARSKPGGLKKR